MGDFMRHIHCLNKISPVGLESLPKEYVLSDQIDGSDAILVRSAAMHEMILPKTVRVVARAGAGVNNIPLDLFAKQGVVVFNTPGANANGVKEITIAGMLLASRDIIGGNRWIEENKTDTDIAKTVEKIKSNYGGTEIKGKTIGIVGLGAIGHELAKACVALGMNVIGKDKEGVSLESYDLPKEMVIVQDIDKLYQSSDFISLHLPLIPETKGMINQRAFKKMKDGVIILNFARDTLVNDDDLEEAIKQKKVRAYVTDFPNPKTVNMPGVIAIPHLGASTEEAEDLCATMAIHQTVQFLEYGNLINSVNFPNASLGDKKHHRLTILGDVSIDPSKIQKILATQTIYQSIVQTNGKYSTMIFDLSQPLDDTRKNEIIHLPGTIRIHTC
jgi:D-3-phosphoglycerate dehydrogenase